MKNDNQEEKAIAKTAEDIATAVAQISRAMRVFETSRLKRKALIILLQHSTKMPQREIEYVLNALETLEDEYLKLADEE